MTFSRYCLSLSAAALLFATGFACAEDLGRLFYFPRERATLDAQRHQSAAPGLEGETITVNGLVKRSSGKSTVWVNGIPQQEGEGSPVKISPKQSVTLHRPGKDNAVDLRVGQTLEKTTGKVREIYESPPATKNTASPEK